MRIDSSLGNAQYQGRYAYGIKPADDNTTENASSSRSRSVGGNSTSAVLSSSLANALWSIDSAAGSAKPSQNDGVGGSASQQVEARYLENMYDTN